MGFDGKLDLYGTQLDSEINMGDLALALVADDHEGISPGRYASHLGKIEIAVGERYNALITSGAGADAATRLAALKYVLMDIHDYRVDEPDYEMLESADIMRVIDRALGTSAALCAMYMIAARAQGWAIEGINFPGRFLCRIEAEGDRIIFDPSQGCKVLDAHDLRVILKEALGEKAELSNDYYEGLDGRASLVHLYNLIKIRRIEMGEYRAALAMVLRLRSVAPDEYRLLLDGGVLYARLNERGNAIECLNEYIDRAPDYYEREEARLLLDELLGG